MMDPSPGDVWARGDGVFVLLLGCLVEIAVVSVRLCGARANSLVAGSGICAARFRYQVMSTTRDRKSQSRRAVSSWREVLGSVEPGISGVRTRAPLLFCWVLPRFPTGIAEVSLAFARLSLHYNWSWPNYADHADLVWRGNYGV